MSAEMTSAFFQVWLPQRLQLQELSIIHLFGVCQCLLVECACLYIDCVPGTLLLPYLLFISQPCFRVSVSCKQKSWYQSRGQHLYLFLGCSCVFSCVGYVFLFASFDKWYFHLPYKDTSVLHGFSNMQIYSIDLKRKLGSNFWSFIFSKVYICMIILCYVYANIFLHFQSSM